MTTKDERVPEAGVTTEMFHLRKFTSIDRESPIFEVMLEGEVIFDIARSDGSDLSSEFEIAFHEAALGRRVPVGVVIEIVHAAQKLIVEDEG
jgi:hypothetical protein